MTHLDDAAVFAILTIEEKHLWNRVDEPAMKPVLRKLAIERARMKALTQLHGGPVAETFKAGPATMDLLDEIAVTRGEHDFAEALTDALDLNLDSNMSSMEKRRAVVEQARKLKTIAGQGALLAATVNGFFAIAAPEHAQADAVLVTARDLLRRFGEAASTIAVPPWVTEYAAWEERDADNIIARQQLVQILQEMRDGAVFLGFGESEVESLVETLKHERERNPAQVTTIVDGIFGPLAAPVAVAIAAYDRHMEMATKSDNPFFNEQAAGGFERLMDRTLTPDGHSVDPEKQLSDAVDTTNRLTAERDGARRLIPSLMEALRPFAWLGGPFDGEAYHDLTDDIVLAESGGTMFITVGDVRVARRVWKHTAEAATRDFEEMTAEMANNVTHVVAPVEAVHGGLDLRQMFPNAAIMSVDHDVVDNAIAPMIEDLLRVAGDDAVVRYLTPAAAEIGMADPEVCVIIAATPSTAATLNAWYLEHKSAFDAQKDKVRS